MGKPTFKALLKYEAINTMSNFFTPFFGIVYPMLMGTLLVGTITRTVPESQQATVGTGIAIVMALVIPMSIMLVSFSALFSQETEQGVMTRMELFNFRERDMLAAKISVHYLIITCSAILYSTVMVLVNNVLIPKLSSFLIFILCFYLLATLLFVFAYSVGALLKKFGTTYAITMTVFFALMGMSGMMGVQPDQLPVWGQKIAYSLPMAHINTDFSKYWVTGFTGYNFMPLIQSFIFMGALVALIYLFSWYKRKRSIGAR